ncbi:MAG: T9SS type A sorting domain-containing protein [Candidatus Zixiibacteriota bacterium]
MKKLIAILLLIAASIFGAEISGTCYNGGMPFPLPMSDVELELVPDSGPASLTVSGMDGTFSFTGVGTGSYTLRPSTATGDPRDYSITVETESDVLTGYDFTITGGGSGEATVAGMIIYDDGSPAPDINLTIVSEDSPMPMLATTDADGKYVVDVTAGLVTITPMAMPPYTAIPEMHEVTVEEGEFAGGLDFRFVGGGPMVYMIMVNGTVDGTPTSFSANYRKMYGDTTWYSVDAMETGSAMIEVSDSGEYIVRAEKPGHRAEPEEQIVTASMLPVTAVFEFIDTSETDDYMITVRATEGLTPVMEFTAKWREESETSWTSVASGMMGTAEITPPGPGTYEVSGWYDGREPVPEITTVELTTSEPTDSVVLNFADTSETSSIELTIISVGAEGVPYPGLAVDWISALDSTVETIVTDDEGIAVLDFDLFASITLTPDPEPGFYTIPDEESFTLTPLNPADTVIFEVYEGTAHDYWVTVSTVDTLGEHFSTFTVLYRNEGDTTWESSFSLSEYQTIEFLHPGTYEFSASKLGYEPVPELISVTLDSLSPVDSVEFVMEESPDTSESDMYVTVISEDEYGEPYPELDFFWTRSLSDETDTLSTGDTGIIDIIIEDMDNYTFTSLPESGFYTIPEEENALITSLSEVDTVIFTVYEGEAGSYRINVSAIDDSSEIVFDYMIQHRSLGADSWNRSFADSTGYTDLIYDFPGDYEVTIWKLGFITIPEIDTVSLTETMPIDTIVFNLTDTSEAEEFSLTILSNTPEGEPYSGLIVEWENTLTGDDGEFETDLGVHTEIFTSSAYLNLTPIVPEDHWVSPENASSFLGSLNPADTIEFIVGEGTPPATYSITIWATDSSDNPQFGTSMGIDDETAMTGMGGYATIEVDGPGDYTVAAWMSEIPGFEFVVVPDTFDITLTETHTADTTHVYITSVDDIEEDISTPEALGLSIYPNPFNGECRIDAPANANIFIYDLSGNLIEILPKGTSSWSAESYGSGIYIVKAISGSDVFIKRALYVK